ncbi:MAG: efflux RND transporter periplasmic adaptor subunit [Aureliella sp.]
MMKREFIMALGLSMLALASTGVAQQPTTQSIEDLLGSPGKSTIPTSQPYTPGSDITISDAFIYCTITPPLPAQTDGVIQELRADEGSVVQKGEVVLVIDSRLAEAELQVAKSQLDAAEILEKQEANVKFSEKAHDLAKEEYEATGKLYVKYAATESELKRKKLEMEKSSFSIDMAQDEREKYRLEAAVAAQQLRASEIKLELHKGKAPCSGIIIERLRDVGEWVRAGDPVFQLLHMDEMKVEANVLLNGIATSQLRNAEMRISVNLGAGQSDLVIPARVTFVSPQIDQGKVRVVAKINNQQDASGNWLLSDGMRVSASITPNP